MWSPIPLVSEELMQVWFLEIKSKNFCIVLSSPSGAGKTSISKRSLQKDRNDYLTLGEEHKHIFTSNLKYQTLLDSVQGRGPCLAFLPFCSLPELE